MKVPMLLKNKYVLYVLLLIGIINVLGYIALNDYDSMSLFIILGVLSSYFSKNMSVNLLIAIIGTSLVAINNKVSKSIIEGLTGKLPRARETDARDSAETSTSPPTNSKKKESSLTASTEIPPSPSTNSKKIKLSSTDSTETSMPSPKDFKKSSTKHELPESPSVSRSSSDIKDREISSLTSKNQGGLLSRYQLDGDRKQSQSVQTDAKKEAAEEEKEEKKCPEGKVWNGKVGGCVAKSNFQNNVPSSSPARIDDEDESVGDRIDYASTMEQAYDNLQKMLGEGGMKNITAETQKLVSQQKNLMSTLHEMAPVLKTAKETLANMNLPNISEISNLMKKFTGNK